VFFIGVITQKNFRKLVEAILGRRHLASVMLAELSCELLEIGRAMFRKLHCRKAHTNLFCRFHGFLLRLLFVLAGRMAQQTQIVSKWRDYLLAARRIQRLISARSLAFFMN
jgi:hypothetical protein